MTTLSTSFTNLKRFKVFLGLGTNYFAGQGKFLVTDSNLAAPTLANYIGGETFFALISSIAFATILGTVSGLIMAAAGAIAHDIYTEILGKKSSEKAALRVSKVTAVAVGMVLAGFGQTTAAPAAGGAGDIAAAPAVAGFA